jgi:hypothetical protein
LLPGLVCFLLCYFFFPETRGDVILHQRAKRLTKSTGRPHFVVGLDEHEGWLEALKTSTARPRELFLLLSSLLKIRALIELYSWR